MIAITTPEYDLNGYVVIPARPANLYEAQRRGSVTATLDGNVSIYDTGYSESDQTLKILLYRPSHDLLVKLRYLVAYYQQLHVSCETGFYSAILSFSLNNATLNLQIRIVKRLD